MNQFIFGLVLLSMPFSEALFGQSSSLSGKVTEQEDDNPVLFGTVYLLKNDSLIATTETDFDGNYSFSGLSWGNYQLQFVHEGRQTTCVVGVKCFAWKATNVDARMFPDLDIYGPVRTVEMVWPVEDRMPIYTPVTTNQLVKIRARQYVIVMKLMRKLTEEGGDRSAINIPPYYHALSRRMRLLPQNNLKGNRKSIRQDR